MSHAQPAAERRDSAAATVALPGYTQPPPDRPGPRDVALAQASAWQATAARERATTRVLAALLVLLVLAAIPLAGFDLHMAAHLLTGR